jgi:F-type H+-transporting ATPase subunit epsilon
MAGFQFELVSPEKLLFSGDVQQVVVPGLEGEFTVLADHAPFMSSLRPGVIVVTAPGGQIQRLFVRGGFADVSPKGLTILAEQAIPVEDASEDVLNAEVKLAEDEFEAAQTPEGRRLAAEKLAHIIELRRSSLH